MKEILFDELTAAEVAERLRAIHLNQVAVDTACLTVARMNGCGPADRVQLNQSGTGIVIIPAVAADSRNGETDSDVNPVLVKAATGKK